MKTCWERIYNGVLKENPALVLMLGMCPTLAVTTSATNGFGMGLSTTAVLIVSNLIISLLRKSIPDEVRLPAYIVIVASLVTVVELLTQAYLPGLYAALGIYIPLIVVNCIILGRAEAYASKNPPLESLFDGVGMGLGFTIASAVASLLYTFVLEPLSLTYLQTIVFILVIAALVQMVEMFLKKNFPAIYKALGIYLPLITTNCAVLGVALTNVQNGYGLVESVFAGFGTAVGFTVAIVLLAGIRGRLDESAVPVPFRGAPLVLLSAALMSIAFMGFGGIS